MVNISLGLSKVQLALLSVYLIVAIDIFGITLVIPVIALYCRFLGADARLVGTLYTVYSGCAFLSSLWVGKLSDRFGRRAVFLYSLFGATAAFLGSGFCTTFIEFAICRGIAGLFTGTIGTAFAFVADVTPENTRAVYMSYVSAVISTCFVVGPMIGGGLATFSIRTPFYAAAGVAGFGLIMAYNYIVEPKVLLANASKKDGSRTESVKLLDGAKPEEEAASSSSTNVANNQEIVGKQEEEGGGSELSNLVSSKDEENEKREVEVASPASDVAAATSPDTPPPATSGGSPWMHCGAMLVGGLGTFLNGSTFTGLAVLVPLILTEETFGLVTSSGGGGRRLQEGGGDGGGDGTGKQHGLDKIPVFLGYYLGLMGLVQAVAMIFIFPRISKSIGILFSGAIGATLLGTCFCLLLVAKKLTDLIPLYIAFGLGNSLARPVSPAYLGSIAPKGRNAEYIAISSIFSNGAMMVSAQITVLFAYSKTAAILLGGFCSILSALIYFIYGCSEYTSSKQKETDLVISEPTVISGEPSNSVLTPLQQFFGKGKAEAEFYDDLESSIREVIRLRKYDRAVTFEKGQQLIKDLLLSGLPDLPDTFDERMEVIHDLYLKTGHEDWARGMETLLPQLDHSNEILSGVPGRA